VSSGIGLLHPGVPVIATSTIQPDPGRRIPTVSLMAGNGLVKLYI
jgi:hypothetical protein